MCLLSCGIAITPVCETAKRLTAASVRIVVKAERMFRNSHTFTVRSSEPDTTLSSRVNTVDVTLLYESVKYKNEKFVLLVLKILKTINYQNKVLTQCDLEIQILLEFDHENPINGKLNHVMQ